MIHVTLGFIISKVPSDPKLMILSPIFPRKQESIRKSST